MTSLIRALRLKEAATRKRSINSRALQIRQPESPGESSLSSISPVSFCIKRAPTRALCWPPFIPRKGKKAIQTVQRQIFPSLPTPGFHLFRVTLNFHSCPYFSTNTSGLCRKVIFRKMEKGKWGSAGTHKHRRPPGPGTGRGTSSCCLTRRLKMLLKH